MMKLKELNEQTRIYFHPPEMTQIGPELRSLPYPMLRSVHMLVATRFWQNKQGLEAGN